MTAPSELREVVARHELKTWPGPFAAVRANLKPWEMRKNDRDYRVGDLLRLHEWCPEANDYTGEIEERRVTWMLEGGQFGLPADYVIMSLTRPAQPELRLEMARAIGSFPAHEDDRGPDNQTLIDYLPAGRGEVMGGETFLYKLVDHLLALPALSGCGVALPLDDPERPFSDSALPEAMIWAGVEALGRAETDLLKYEPGKTIDWDQGMIVVAIYRAMTQAALSLLPGSSWGREMKRSLKVHEEE